MKKKRLLSCTFPSLVIADTFSHALYELHTFPHLLYWSSLAADSVVKRVRMLGVFSALEERLVIPARCVKCVTKEVR